MSVVLNVIAAMIAFMVVLLGTIVLAPIIGRLAEFIWDYMDAWMDAR